MSGADIAVAICTYNPDERLLTRTLAAVEAQTIAATGAVECVIVDNNSSRAVAQLPVVASFLGRCSSWARVIREPQPGLSYARIAAIDATTAPIVCFVDDDNEPAADYLRKALDILGEHPDIGAIGPGKVAVEFIDPVDAEFAQRFRPHFQEKDAGELTYGCVDATWKDYYPPGSCLTVRREVLAQYRAKYLAGALTASDRVGNALSSGGDTQIVWEAVKMKFAAGISPDLRIVHMIPAKRSTLAYMKRLCYGTASSYMPHFVNSFPEARQRAVTPLPTDLQITRNALRIAARNLVRFRAGLAAVDLASYFGALIGMMRASDGVDRPWLRRYVRLLRLE